MRVIGEVRDSRWTGPLLVPLTILAWLAVIIVVAFLLSHVTHALLVLVLGTVVAFALTPLVNILARWLPRGVAIAIAYVVGVAVVLALLSVVVVSAATEVAALARSLPDDAMRAKALEPQVVHVLGPFGVTRDDVNQAEARLVGYLEGISAQAASDALDLVRSVLNAVVDTVLVLILSVYLVANQP